MDTNNVDDIINEAKANSEGETLSQYTVHITKDQASAIQKQVDLRRDVGIRCSFSEVLRELVDVGFAATAETTETLRSMRGKGHRLVTSSEMGA
jgi:hypothetical protein